MVADYYAILEVDAAAPRAAIEAALARLQPLWSSGTRNPKTKYRFQSYLDQIPAIRTALLSSVEARAAYDSERSAALRAEREGRLDELQRLVRLRAAKGGLTPDDHRDLLDRARRLELNASDLAPMVAPFAKLAAPGPAAQAPKAEPAPDVLDAVSRKQIASALAYLRRRDLYDVLGLGRDAPGDEIADRAQRERQAWMQKAQVTADKTAWLEAISHAQTHLGTAERRARYDRTLALEAEEQAGEAIAFALDGLSRLDGGTRLALIDDATARGVAPDRALTLIDRACRAKGLGQAAEGSLLFSASVEPPRFLRCRSCAGLTDFNDLDGPGARPQCRHCRATLRWTCPACRKERWVDEPRCACGFAQEFAEPLTRHLDAARAAHRDRRFAESLDHLHRVLRFAPNHAGARKGMAGIRQLAAQADAARQACDAARSRRQLVAARAAIGQWAALAPDDLPELVAARDEVERGLRMAESLAAKGHAARTSDPRAARAWFGRALGIAADLDDARGGLLACPPEPPAGLEAEFDGDRVRLRWTPPPPDPLGPVRFRILRKRDGVPANPGDGTVVAEVSGSEADDRTPRAGDAVGYAVVAVRGDVTSAVAATAGPVAVVPDVANLAATVRAGEARLSWDLPARASGVRVVRNLRRRPIDDRDGDPLPSADGEAIDRGLVDGRTYHYAVFAVYRDPRPGGAERLSRGAGISVVPHPPAAPIGPPRWAREPDGRVRLAWDRPARGSARLIRTMAPLPLAPGDRVPVASLSGWSGTWIDVTDDDHAVDEAPPSAGLCVYTPIGIGPGGATVGHPARYSCVADPSDLRAVRAGGSGRVHLRWRWGPNCVETRVLARAGAPPAGPDDPEATRTSVSDAEYGRLGYYALTLPASPAGPWHLAVFSIATMRDGEAVASPGLEPTARTVVPGPHPEVTVSYVVRRPGFTNRSWSVVFRTEPAGAAIPPTALVAHPRTVPLSPDDGEIVVRFPAAQDGESFTIPAHVDLARRRTRVFADPASDPDGLPPIRLRHPEGGATRV